MAHARVVANQACRQQNNWSNQELAEFYRVGEILRRSGWVVDVDRGWTDEGEPWLVYCDQRTGDVITHFAKIDDAYVVASAVLDAPIRGQSFSVLLDRLMARFTTPQQLHAVHATGTITYAHPIASLAALVAAMCALNDMTRREGPDVGYTTAGDQSGPQDGHHGDGGASGVDPALPPISAAAVVRAKLLARGGDADKLGEDGPDQGTPTKYGTLIVNLVAAVIGLAAGSVLSAGDTDATGLTLLGTPNADGHGHGGGGDHQHASVDYTAEISPGGPALTAVDLIPDVQVGADDEVRIAHVIVAEMAVGIGAGPDRQPDAGSSFQPLRLDFSHAAEPLFVPAGWGEVLSVIGDRAAETHAADETTTSVSAHAAAPTAGALASARATPDLNVHTGTETADHLAGHPGSDVATVHPAATPALSTPDSFLAEALGLGTSFAASVGFVVTSVQTLPPVGPAIRTAAVPEPLHPTSSDTINTTLVTPTAVPASATESVAPFALADTFTTLKLGGYAFALQAVDDHVYDRYALADVIRYFLHESGEFKVIVAGHDYYLIDADAYDHSPHTPPLELESIKLQNGETIHLIGVGDIFDRMSAHFA